MNNYNYPQPPSFDSNANMLSVESRVGAAMKSIYLKMTLALALTGFVAYFLGYSAPGTVSAYNYYFFTHSWMPVSYTHLTLPTT